MLCIIVELATSGAMSDLSPQAADTTAIFVDNSVFGDVREQDRGVGGIRLERDDAYPGRMRRSLEAEESPVRPDVNEHVAGPERSLEQVARGPFIAGPELADDQMPCARIDREPARESDLKPGSSVLAFERRRQRDPTGSSEAHARRLLSGMREVKPVIWPR
jgi:hypothetical protein